MGKKSKSSGHISGGGRQSANVRHEQKRQAKFAAKRGTDREYKYVPNPYKKGTVEYNREAMDRAEKARSSKLPYARLESIFAKLDNELAKQKLQMKKVKSNFQKFDKEDKE